MDLFRCIHCRLLHPRTRASVKPFPATDDNPIPIGVCDQQQCLTDHEACHPAKRDDAGAARFLREHPRMYWGTCLDCKGAVWQGRPRTWDGSWAWACAHCGMRWRFEPPEDEVEQENGLRRL